MERKFDVILFLLLLVLVAGTIRCDAKDTTDSLTYLAHSFVKIKTSEGKIITIDPYAVIDADSADIVLITHEHSDHNDLTRVHQRSGCQVIRSANALQGGVYQDFTIGNTRIKAVPAHDAYHAKAECVGYVIQFDSIKIYHGGDTGPIPEMSDLAAEYITYAFLPMYMGAEALTQAVAMIQPKYVIPIHTNFPDITYSNSAVMPFTSPHRLIILPGQTIELKNNALPHIGRMLRVPEEYSTIQTAIDSAESNDTILVSEGTYHENIRYNGKGIVITSRYLITHDWETVRNTVIDGSIAPDKNKASTVTLLNGEDSTAVLEGFTITGGTGTLWIYGANRPQEGGGIILNLSSAIIRNNIIKENTVRTSAGVISGGGGGISSLYSNPSIYNNLIISNTSGYAGGVVLNWSKGKIRNNIICFNSAVGQYGAGGIMVWQAPENGGIVENNTIVGNISTTAIAGAISISVPDATKIPVIKNNIIWGNRQAAGGQVDNPSYLTGYNDVEDYSSGTNFSSYPQFQECSLHLSSGSSCIDAGDPDTIKNDIENQVIPGTAATPSLGTVRNDIGAFGGPYTNSLPSIDTSDISVSKKSVSLESTTGQWITSGIGLFNRSSRKLIIDSVCLTGTPAFSLHDNLAGKALEPFESDSITIDFGSAIMGVYVDTIKIFHRIAGKADPMLIALNGKSDCLPYLNRPIPDQQATVGRIFSFQIPDSTFLDGDQFDSLTYQATGLPSWLSFDSQMRLLQGIPEQMALRPLSIRITVHDRLLLSASTTFSLSVQSSTQVKDPKAGLGEYELLQNYPNPFNPETNIEFSLQKKSFVSLKIFNVLGEEVACLINAELDAGRHHREWRANPRLSSGVYFLKLQAGTFTGIKKLIYQK